MNDPVRPSLRAPAFALVAALGLVLVACDPLLVSTLAYFDESTVASLRLGHDDGYAGFQLLERNLDGKSVLFTGEIHGNAESVALAAKTARYLQHSGRRTTLLWEVGFATGVQLDRYLRGGDESILEQILAGTRGTFFFTHEWRDFYRDLRRFNMDVPPDEQIRLVGIDIEHQYRWGMALMQELLPHTAPQAAPEPIRDVVAGLVSWSDSTAEHADELSAAISDSLEEHAGEWDALLDDESLPLRADHFRTAAFAVRSRFDCYALDRGAFAAAREAAIAEIFRRADAIHRSTVVPGNAIYYGHWGRDHVPLRRVRGVDWVAGLINEMPEYQGGVLSVAAFYHASMSLERNPYRARPVSDSPLAVGLMARHARSPATLFDLAAPDSPFRMSLELVPEPNDGGVTTDYFQMAILFSRATTSRPLE